jgi:hypothetical protein
VTGAEPGTVALVNPEKLGLGYADRYPTVVDQFHQAAHYACGYFDAIIGSVRLREGYAAEDED